MQQLRNLGDLKRYSLQARGGEIGRIVGMYFDDADWMRRAGKTFQLRGRMDLPIPLKRQ